MSNLANATLYPFASTLATAMSTEVYCKEHSSGSMPSFMLWPSGCDKSTIRILPKLVRFLNDPKPAYLSLWQLFPHHGTDDPAQLDLLLEILVHHPRDIPWLGCSAHSSVGWSDSIQWVQNCPCPPCAKKIVE